MKLSVRRPVSVLALVLASVAVPLPATSEAADRTPSAAHARVASNGGGYELRLVNEHIGSHLRCRRTVLNGISDSGEIIGTAYCGRRDEAFLQMPDGHQVRYRLPRRLAQSTLASNIASDGTFAVVGTKRPGGAPTSYLVSADRRQRRPLRDPRAHWHGTVVNGLNSSGMAVGTYCPTKRCLDPKPFVFRDNRFSALHLQMRDLHLVTPTAINDHGYIAGYAFDGHGVAYAFLLTPGQPPPDLITARHSGNLPGAGVYVDGLNNSNFVVGSSVSNRGRLRTFVSHQYESYKVISRTPQRPKSYTELIGVNDDRVVVGFWYDAKHHRSRGLIGRPAN